MAARALITGISGQDGSYLAELLLEKGYEVHGVLHGGNLGLVGHLAGEIVAHPADLRDGEALARAIGDARPDELYHLGGVTRPQESWDDPVGTFDIVTGGTIRILDIVSRVAAETRVFVAGSSEMFGRPASSPQDECTPPAPRNPYGAAKAAGLAAAQSYRHGRGLHVVGGILFNHESPRRPDRFVTRKVTRGAAAIARGEQRELRLGNLDARRDWGFAPDYMEGAWRSLQADAPGDYVFATGVLHSVRELVELAFARAGVPLDGHVVVDPALVHPDHEVPMLGDPGRAREELGWEASTSFEDMIAAMVEADLQDV